ncbi:ferrochelatase [Chloroflexi bacterium TSY]|nr:ferrochelatase [Chloroflexi bacterium TSY]
MTYDAILMVSFGGPEGMDDVMPFLENVLRGRNVPRERMLEVARHYEQFNGVSPINEQNRTLIWALESELTEHELNMPIYWGNRNWHPMLPDVVQQMADDGVERALAFFTSMFSCYSGCRQYRENIYDAQEKVGLNAPIVDKIRMGYNHPGFIQANVDHVRAALDQIPTERRRKAHLVFTAHSIPLAQAQNCRYVEQLTESSRLVAEAVADTVANTSVRDNWQLVYQSRRGPPQMPWLEPDICDHLKSLPDGGVQDVVVLPIGFISDHMEVIFDLDTEAQEVADAIGLNLVRAASVGTHPAFVGMIRELITERMSDAPKRRAIGKYGPNHDVCPANCCLSGRPVSVRPAAAQM